MPSKNDIAENLKAIINNSYIYAKNTRGEEYAIYDDFEERFISTSSEKDALKAFVEVLSNLEKDEDCKMLFWLASAYNIPLHSEAVKIINSNVSTFAEQALLRYFCARAKEWPKSEFSFLTPTDTRELKAKAANYGLQLDL